MTEDILAYARSMLGTPYVYGGNNRLQGLDCSGFICEVLRGFGLVKAHEDMNAAALFEKFGKVNNCFPQATALIFFGESAASIEHVALALNSWRMIEAGGGDHTVTDRFRATVTGAMVRERPISARRDRIAVIMPPWLDPET